MFIHHPTIFLTFFHQFWTLKFGTGTTGFINVTPFVGIVRVFGPPTQQLMCFQHQKCARFSIANRLNGWTAKKIDFFPCKILQGVLIILLNRLENVVGLRLPIDFVVS